MDLIDLSMTLGPEVEPVPGHPHFHSQPLTTLERDGVNNSLITLSIHTGTHIDAAYHFIQSGQTIDQIPKEFPTINRGTTAVVRGSATSAALSIVKTASGIVSAWRIYS